MQEYVAIICKNCGNCEVYTLENFKKINHTHCACGNGRLQHSSVDYANAMKRDFEYIGLERFLKEGLFDYYGEKIGKSADKGFEVIKLKTDIE